MMRLCCASRAGMLRCWGSASRMPCFLRPTWTPLRSLSALSRPLPPCQVLQKHNTACSRGCWAKLHYSCKALPAKGWRLSKGSLIRPVSDIWPVLRKAWMCYLCTGGARPLREKSIPGLLDVFGWCTWDAFYSRVSARGRNPLPRIAWNLCCELDLYLRYAACNPALLAWLFWPLS